MQQLLTGRGRGARRAVVVEDPAKLGHQYLPVCSKVQIQEAIDKFQVSTVGTHADSVLRDSYVVLQI